MNKYNSAMSAESIYLEVLKEFVCRGMLVGAFGGMLYPTLLLLHSAMHLSPYYYYGIDQILRSASGIVFFTIIGSIPGLIGGLLLALIHGLFTVPIIADWLHQPATRAHYGVIVLPWASAISFGLTLIGINELHNEIAQWAGGNHISLLALSEVSILPAALAVLGTLHTTHHILWKYRTRVIASKPHTANDPHQPT